MVSLLSDHSPASLDTDIDNQGCKCLDLRGFGCRQMVLMLWWPHGGGAPTKRPVAANIVSKLRYLRQQIKSWCRESFYSVRQTKKDFIRQVITARNLGKGEDFD